MVTGMKGNGHRWIFVPIVLALTLLGAILYLSRESFIRLESAAERVRVAEERQTALAEFLLLVTEAETAQRSYLLTRNRQYLAPYEKAIAELPLSVQWLLEDYERHGPSSSIERIHWLEGLTAGKLREIGESLALYRRGGIGSAMSLVRTEFGRKSMDQIRELGSSLQTEEALAVEAAAQSWRRELRLGRLLIIAATTLAMLLVFVAALLVMRDVHRRREHARQLEAHNAELDAQVRSRTEALSNLSSALQRVTEREKQALARELHDELGSLLIAAKMDMSWLRRRLSQRGSGRQAALGPRGRRAGRRRQPEAAGRRAPAPDAARQPWPGPGDQVGARGVLRPGRNPLDGALPAGGPAADRRCLDRGVPSRAGITDQHCPALRREECRSRRRPDRRRTGGQDPRRRQGNP